MEGLQEFIYQYGLWAVAIGAFCEGQTILLCASFLANRHVFHPVDLFVVAALSAWTGHVFWYYFGKHLDVPSLRSRHPRWGRNMETMDRIIRGQPWRSVFFLQYGYGMRLAGAIAFGFTRLSPAWFFLAQALNCAIWAGLLIFLGFNLGEMLLFDQAFPFTTLGIVLSLLITLLLINKSLRQSAEPDNNRA